MRFLKEVISNEQSDSEEEEEAVTSFTQGGQSSSTLSSREADSIHKKEGAPEATHKPHEDINTSQAVNINSSNENVVSMIDRFRFKETNLLPGRKDSGLGEEIFEFNPNPEVKTLILPLTPKNSQLVRFLKTFQVFYGCFIV